MRSRTNAPPVSRFIPATLVVLVIVPTACVSVLPRGMTAPAPVPDSPARVVAVPPPTPTETTTPSLPADLLAPNATVSLAQVVDVALANNPSTRATYLQARAAAAALGSKRGAYYPSIDLQANFTRAGQANLGGQFNTLYNTYGPGVALNYLLFDLGGRRGDAEEARQALLAADFSHNAAIQDVVFIVQQTYYSYQNAKAQLEAAVSSVAQARASLDAATGRHNAGVATIADVLQAKTALSQAELLREAIDGDVMAVRGALATAMGLPAGLPFDVGSLPAEVATDAVSPTVEQLMAAARTNRPDLEALRAQAEKSVAHIASVRSQGLPSLALQASANRTYFDPHPYEPFGSNWSAALLLRYPLFYGFSKSYDVAKARADAGAAQAQAESYEQQVILQVWTGYYGLATATQRVSTAKDLVASADQSERVARGRYKEGVGTIIDLLTAQSALASARAQEIQARADWFTAVARIAHYTGAAAPNLDTTIAVEPKREP